MKSILAYIFLITPVVLIGQGTDSLPIFKEVSLEVGIYHEYLQFENIFMGSGVAFFDYNNDHFEDLYFTGGERPDQLFKNNGDGTFSNETYRAGIFIEEITCGVVTGDLDNDGFRDIIVTTIDSFKLHLLHNNGDGTFSDFTNKSGLNGPWNFLSEFQTGFSPALGDLNLDGFLDIFVPNWIDQEGILFDPDTNEIIGFSHTCAPAYLFINNGDGSFSELSEVYGVDDSGCGLSSIFSDYDNDGDLDILIANDFGEWLTPDQLYQNNYPLPTFSDESESSGFNTPLFGMGIAVGDYDQDRDLDYYKTSIGAHALNTNQGNGSFVENALEAGIQNTYYGVDSFYLNTGWGSGFFDIDNDTWLDLVVAQGAISFSESSIISSRDSLTDMLWQNQQNGTFKNVSQLFSPPNFQLSRGVAYGDYDNDGDLDLVFSNVFTGLDLQPGRSVVYNNQLSNDKKWLKVKLTGTKNNRDGFGAHLTLFVNGKSWVHEINSGGQGHNSQHSSVAHFGLGQAITVDSIIVSWPGDLSPPQIFKNLPANQFINIVEGVANYEVLQEEIINPVSNLSRGLMPIRIFPNPANLSTRLIYNSKTGQGGRLLLYDQTGRIKMTQSVNSLPGSNQLNVNLESLSPGIYWVQLILDDRVQTVRLIVNR